jgi:putative regulatory protein, FmdB family
MPIYEFYCTDCHTIFNFFSRRVNTEKRPSCPRCGRLELERQVSLFSISKGRKPDSDDAMVDIDDERMERAMEALAGDAESIDENDPRTMARMMRKLYDATGLKLGPGIEEAIHRMEAGEDPNHVEEEMGDILENEDSFVPKSKTGLKDLYKRMRPPKVDETFYEL